MRSRCRSGLAVTQAMLAVGLAVSMHVVLPANLRTHLPFVPFALAVLVSSRWGGRSAGSAATFLSAMALHAWFLSPAQSFLDEGCLGLGLFIAAGLFVSAQLFAPQPLPSRLTEPTDESPMLPMFEYVAPESRRRIAA